MTQSNSEVDLFIVTGELSGDLLASRVVSELHARAPHLRIAAVGGPNLQAMNVATVGSIEPFQALCARVWTPRAALSAVRAMRNIGDRLVELRPGVCLFVDASLLTFRLAMMLRRASFRGKIVKYVAPGLVWPDRGRIQRTVDLFDALIAIFPNESQYFSGSRLAVSYFGHPLAHDRCVGGASADFATDGPLVALYPGSRMHHVKRALPVQLATCAAIQVKHPDVRVVIACATEQIVSLAQKMTKSFALPNVRIELTQSAATKCALMNRTTVAIATPGTSNIELAMHGVPTLVAYPLSWLLRIAHWAFKKKAGRSIRSIANFVAGETLFPELLGDEPFGPKSAVAHLEALLFDANVRADCVAKCQKLRASLQNPTPGRDVASMLLKMLAESPTAVVTSKQMGDTA